MPCTAKAILTLLHQHSAIKDLFPRDAGQRGPTVVIFNSSPRIGIPLQSMLVRLGATVVLVTHDARVAAYADRVATVRDGVVSAVDLPAVTASSAAAAKGVS